MIISICAPRRKPTNLYPVGQAARSPPPPEWQAVSVLTETDS
jgi:hypothetical protein